MIYFYFSMAILLIAVFILLNGRLRAMQTELNKIDRALHGAIIFLPQLDASISSITDYGNMIGIGASKDSKRISWYMPVDAAVMFRDELIRVLKKDDCVLGKKGKWVVQETGEQLTHTDPPCKLCELEKYAASEMLKLDK